MSMVATPSGAPVEATPRAAMTLARKKRIHALVGGQCRWCGLPVEVSGPGVVYDHRIPLTLGGEDTDDNIRPLHARPCDAAKTALDRKVIAKVARLRDKKRREAKAKRAKRRWPKSSARIASRGFAPTRRREQGADN